MKPLPVSFFRRPADVVARELLGGVIVSTAGRRRCTALIVETEAYLGRDDPASHAFGGRRHRGNASLYANPGIWYVYLSYGMHWCANLVCLGPEAGGAVLLRAVSPLEGVETMRRRRGSVAERDLANGPGKLCRALGITRALDGVPMVESEVRIERPAAFESAAIRVTPRIGITKAVDWPLRFLLTTQAQARKVG